MKLKLKLHIKNSFGLNYSYRLIINSVSFTVLLFFYTLSIGSLFQPTIYPLIDRITFSTPFVDKYYINSIVDFIIIILSTIFWLNFATTNNKKYLFIFGYIIATLFSFFFHINLILEILVFFSFPIVLVLIISDKLFNKKNINFESKLYVKHISIFGFLVAVLSLCITILSIYAPDLSIPNINYLYYNFLLFSFFSPIYLIIISLSFPLNQFFRYLTRSKSKSKKDVSHSVINKSNTYNFNFKPSLKIIILLLSIISLAIIISLIPHLHLINNDNQIIGSDTDDYSNMLLQMRNSSDITVLLDQAFKVQMGGDRPFSLLLFFTIFQTIPAENISFFLDYLPVILSPFLILSIYFLTFELTRNYSTSLLACLFTIPYHILIGMYGGLYANWFSLIFGYLSILFLFKALQQSNKEYYLVFSILLVILLLTHTPTWTIFMYVIVIFLVVIYGLRLSKRKPILYLFIASSPSIIIDLIRMVLINTSGVLQEINFAQNRNVGIHNIYEIWNNLVDSSQLYMAGLIGNPVILLLIVYWIFKSNSKNKHTIFLLVFFSLSIIPLLFAEQEIQTRFYYEIPFQIPAAISLTILQKEYGKAIMLAVCMWVIVTAIRASSNFYLVIK